MLLQQIEDLYDDNWAKSKGIQWLMSFGRKQSILTNLKFALPIIVKLFEQIHQDNQNLKSNLDSTIFDLQWTQALYNQGFKEATEDLELQIQRLYETLREHKLKDEINLLKSRALRSQVIELQQFISNISSNIPIYQISPKLRPSYIMDPTERPLLPKNPHHQIYNVRGDQLPTPTTMGRTHRAAPHCR